MTEMEIELPELTVEEQVALMYLGTVDEAASNTIAHRAMTALAPPDEKVRPRNADVLYALVSMLTMTMGRMSGTVAFKQTILRGFGDVAAGQLGLMAERARQAASKGAELGATEPPEEERAPPKPYTSKASPEDDVYTVEEFKAAVASGAFQDDDGHGRQACKLGPDLIYYSPTKKHAVAPSDFAGPDAVPMMPGTSHIVWFNK